jgi:hypothetical protein
MQKTYLVLVIIALNLAFWGCTKKIQTTAKTETTTVKQPTETSTIQVVTDNETTLYEVISIRRTACFGKCPSYEARIMSDGSAVYIGGNNVERMGTYTAVANKDELKTLVDMSRQVKYFSFQDRYPADRKNEIADLPSTLTSVNDGRSEKKIVNNYDCPAELIEFERTIDAFFEKLNWVSTK